MLVALGRAKAVARIPLSAEASRSLADSDEAPRRSRQRTLYRLPMQVACLYGIRGTRKGVRRGTNSELRTEDGVHRAFALPAFQGARAGSVLSTAVTHADCPFVVLPAGHVGHDRPSVGDE